MYLIIFSAVTSNSCSASSYYDNELQLQLLAVYLTRTRTPTPVCTARMLSSCYVQLLYLAELPKFSPTRLQFRCQKAMIHFT
jgi:hypothetical protein